jgi:hypothetical protein
MRRVPLDCGAAPRLLVFTRRLARTPSGSVASTSNAAGSGPEPRWKRFPAPTCITCPSFAAFGLGSSPDSMPHLRRSVTLGSLTFTVGPRWVRAGLHSDPQ